MVKKIVLREVQFFFLTLFLLGIGSLPFLTGHFSISQNYPSQQQITDTENNAILDDNEIINHHYAAKKSSLLKLEWHKNNQNEKNHRPIINDVFFLSIYTFLLLFLVYPVRYILYLLNILLE